MNGVGCVANESMQKRAIVAGAGPGGLAAAIALQGAGFATTVCERAASLRTGGCGLTLWPNAMRALEHLGAVNDVSARGARISRIEMRNWRDKRIFSDHLAGLVSDVRHAGTTVTRADLIDVLAARFAGPILFDAPVVGMEHRSAGVTARLADGRLLDCDLLVGADGLRSRIRAQMVQHDDLRYAGFIVWRGMSEGDFARDTGIIWMGPGRQFGCFPLSQGKTYWFAGMRAVEGSRQLQASRSELANTFADWSAPAASAIRATRDSDILCNEIYDRRTLTSWSQGCVTLLGDAAHPASPTLGQGACQAIEDAVVLGHCLGQERDITAALSLYERARIGRANAFVREARLLSVLGFWQNPLACFCRDAFMRATPARVRQAQLARSFAFSI